MLSKAACCRCVKIPTELKGKLFFTVPPASNDPLADFKRERQKYKSLRKQIGTKGQSREEITLSLLNKFKTKLNSAKTLAGDYSDEEEEEEKIIAEEDVSDLSW